MKQAYIIEGRMDMELGIFFVSTPIVLVLCAIGYQLSKIREAIKQATNLLVENRRKEYEV